MFLFPLWPAEVFLVFICEVKKKKQTNKKKPLNIQFCSKSWRCVCPAGAGARVFRLFHTGVQASQRECRALCPGPDGRHCKLHQQRSEGAVLNLQILRISDYGVPVHSTHCLLSLHRVPASSYYRCGLAPVCSIAVCGIRRSLFEYKNMMQWTCKLSHTY